MARNISQMLPLVREKPLGPEHLVICFSTLAKGETGMVPQGLAVCHNGDYIVSDSYNKNVKIFTKSGQFKGYLGNKGKARIKTPKGVAALANGYIAVSDFSDNSIKIFSSKYRLIARYQGSHIKCPEGISVQKGNEVVFINESSITYQPTGGQNHRLIPIQSTKVVKEAPHLAAAANGDVIVVETVRHRLLAIDPSGDVKVEHKLTATGMYNCSIPGYPSGICIDKYGNVLVADSNNSIILVFDHKYELRNILHTDDWFRLSMRTHDYVSVALTLQSPKLLAITDKGYLAVLEQVGKLKVFSYASCLDSELTTLVQPADSNIMSVEEVSGCCICCKKVKSDIYDPDSESARLLSQRAIDDIS